MTQTGRALPATFLAVAAVCVAFFVLTIAAMLLYPGGSQARPQSASYSFFLNFFSDLGQTHVKYGDSGASNLPSMVLFCIALTAAACAMAAFFISFASLFGRSGTAAWLGRAAAICGVIAAVCFIGVAFTPWNLYLQAHNAFVTWAFFAFLAAVLLLIAAVVLDGSLPPRFAWIFAGFAVVLALYVVLLKLGPPPTTPLGAIAQPTGQKVIAYASMLTVLVQSLGAYVLLSKNSAR